MSIQNFFLIPQRYIMAIMAFLGLVNAYIMRICLSLAITEMVVKGPPPKDESSGVCMADRGDIHYLDKSSELNDDNKFNWSEERKGFILSAFFVGYFLSHVPGGIIADKFGGKWTLGIGVLATGVFTLLTPVCVTYGGSMGLIILRVATGICEGPTFPALSALLARWVPLNERGKIGALVFGGGQIGVVVGQTVSGIVLDHYNTWEPVFYFWSVIALIWFIIFALIVYDDPQTHPFIKDSEKEYLAEELGTKSKKDLPPIPWVAIMTSLPMIALISAQVGHDWGFYVMVTDLPLYMADVMQFPVKQNGFFSSFPYLLMWIVSMSCGVISDYVIKKGYMGITTSRKFYTIVAAVGPGIFMVGASYAGCNRTSVVVLFTFALGFMGGFYSGMKLNPLDFSPNYSGTVMAITNAIGALAGVMVPISVAYMTPNRNLSEWRLVFWLAFVIFVVTSIIYGIWGSGEVQPFNDPIKMKEDKLNRQEKA